MPLYLEAFDPLTADWFEQLLSEPAVDRILDASGLSSLIRLQWLNRLFEKLADRVMDQVSPTVVDVISRHRDGVKMLGKKIAEADASPDEVANAFRAKLKWNIGQGLLEALLCYVSIRHFLEEAGVVGTRRHSILARSTGPVSRLAALHDMREDALISSMLGGRDYIYPRVTVEQVHRGELIIPARYFTLEGPTSENEQVQLPGPVPSVQGVDSPTMMCPGQRLKAKGTDDLLNERFWALVVRACAPT